MSRNLVDAEPITLTLASWASRAAIISALLVMLGTSVGTAATINPSEVGFVNQGVPTAANDGTLRTKNDVGFIRKGYAKYDLSNAIDAPLAVTLDLTFVDSGVGTGSNATVNTFNVYGLNDGDAGEGWLGSTLTWNNAPANDTGGIGMLGNSTLLGSFSLTGKTGSVQFSNSNLHNFYHGDTDGSATIMVVRTNDPGDSYVHQALPGGAANLNLVSSAYQADFNELAVNSPLNGQASSMSSGNWNGSSTIGVVGGDLDVTYLNPLYRKQIGSPQSVQGTNGSTASVSTVLDVPMFDDEIWFSFLVNQTNADARTGIRLNGVRILAVGDVLRIIGGSDTASGSIVPIGQDSLLVGRVIVDESGNDSITLWLNPTEILGIENTTPSLVNLPADVFSAAGITSLSLESYGIGDGGVIDQIFLTNSQASLAEALVAPEPGTFAMASLALGCALIFVRLRKQFARA